MAIELITKVWADQTITDQGELLILLALADFSNRDGLAFPSVQSLADKARITKRAAQRILRRLEESGKIRTKTGGGHSRNSYNVIVDAPATLSRPDPKSPVTLDTPTDDHGSSQQRPMVTSEMTLDTPNPSLTVIDPSLEPSGKRVKFKKPDFEALNLRCAKIGLPATEAGRFFDHYESNGWKVGKVPMVSWESALQNWKRNYDEKRNNTRNGVARNSGRNAGTYNEGTASQYGDYMRRQKAQVPNPQRPGSGTDATGNG